MRGRKRTRESAEAKLQRMRPEAEKAKAEYEAKAEILRKRTARLKALREARERKAEPDAAADKKTRR